MFRRLEVALAVARFAADDTVRVVVMHGAGGKAFASGADIREFERARADADAEAESLRQCLLNKSHIFPIALFMRIGGGVMQTPGLINDLRSRLQLTHS